jgi:hypothetical protein
MNGILIFNLGKVDELFQLVKPTVEKYCQKYNIELFIETETPKGCPHPKFGIFSYDYDKLSHVDRLLILDSDIYIRDCAPNVFETYPENFIGWNEGEVHRKQGDLWKGGFEREIQKRVGEVLPEWPEWHINGGFQLSSPEHRIIYQLPPYDVNLQKNKFKNFKVVKNQPWLNFQLVKHNIPVQCADRRWNYLNPIHPNNIQKAKTAYFWHLTGNDYGRLSDKKKMFNIMTDKYESKSEKSTCMYTVVIGREYERLSKYTMANMINYSEKYNFDFKVVKSYDNNKYPGPAWTKIEEAEKLLNQYEQILYVDIDVIIHPKSPNVFQYLKNDFLCFDSLNELKYMTNSSHNSIKKYLSKITGEKVNKLSPPYDEYYLNTGVFCANQKARSLFQFDEKEIIEIDRMWEQTALCVKLMNSDVKYDKLPRQFNYGHLHKEKNLSKVVKDNYFYHLNGIQIPFRVSMTNKILNIIEKGE